MPLLMIGQNLQSAHTELLSENDFEVNKKAERQTEELLEIVKRLEQKIDKLEEQLKMK